MSEETFGHMKDEVNGQFKTALAVHKNEEDERTGSEWCPVAGFRISGLERRVLLAERYKLKAPLTH
jgi:hypothetical protein